MSFLLPALNCNESEEGQYCSCIQMQLSLRPTLRIQIRTVQHNQPIQCKAVLVFSHVHKRQTELCVRICFFPTSNLLNRLFLYMPNVFRRLGGGWEEVVRDSEADVCFVISYPLNQLFLIIQDVVK